MIVTLWLLFHHSLTIFTPLDPICGSDNQCRKGGDLDLCREKGNDATGMETETETGTGTGREREKTENEPVNGTKTERKIGRGRDQETGTGTGIGTGEGTEIDAGEEVDRVLGIEAEIVNQSNSRRSRS